MDQRTVILVISASSMSFKRIEASINHKSLMVLQLKLKIIKSVDSGSPQNWQSTEPFQPFLTK